MTFGVVNGSQNSSLMTGYAVALGDAVLRHRARSAEQSARIESELASRVKSEFIANMSHELRTPLNTIIGFSKLLSGLDRHQLQSGEIVEYAELIHDAAGHLLAIINDILDISKIQSGKYTLDNREIAIDEVVQSAVSTFTPLAEESGIALSQHVAMDVPLVRGDSAKLNQVISNLISNAIKFTGVGGKVVVEAMGMQDGGAVILVRDTGIGMTDEEVSIAMTPFGQVDGGRARWREGTGLGLPIAKALIELHGGRIEIKSQKNVGTEVAVFLPSRHQVTVSQGREIALQERVSI